MGPDKYEPNSSTTEKRVTIGGVMSGDPGSASFALSGQAGENSPPEVRMTTPEHLETFAWGEQVRYSVIVSDEEDGESRYGEIPPNEVLLEIEYLPEEDEETQKTEPDSLSGLPKNLKDPEGLSFIRGSTCFGCHGDKTRVVGPSFSDISSRYEAVQPVIDNLANRIIKGTTGNWGSVEMPSHPDFSQEEARQIAEYILEQGGNDRRWIYPGIEGVFRIMEKPEGVTGGIYLLTASYRDQGVEEDSASGKRGSHSILLNITDEP